MVVPNSNVNSNQALHIRAMLLEHVRLLIFDSSRRVSSLGRFCALCGIGVGLDDEIGGGDFLGILARITGTEECVD